MKYDTHILDNGIRIIHRHSISDVAYCGLLINTGSRDECVGESGVAHFIEHTLFKGTGKRRSYHILNRMESVGGEIDAYTSKEETIIYGTFLCSYYDRFLELLSDIVFNSTFSEKDIEKEKVVILDEINSYLDTPNESIYDDFDELLFRNHSLGRNILGSEQSVKRINRNTLINFIEKKYNTDQMVLCSIGNIDFEKFKKVAKKYFNDYDTNLRDFARNGFYDYVPFSKTVKKNTYQAHCIVGNLAYNSYDEKRTGLLLLNNVLGGPGMNSRLNLTLREKHGLVYNVESSYSKYSDTGNWHIYFGTDKENLDKTLDLVGKELKMFREKKFSTMQLHRAKKQLVGQIAISADNNANLFFTLCKSFLLYDKVDGLKEVSSRIEQISAGDILDIANEIFDEDKLSRLIYV